MSELKKLNINGYEIVVEKETAEIYNHFRKFTETQLKPEIFSELLVKTFNMYYMKDLSSYYSTDTMGRSNWTQHTANTFLRTCQLVNLVCDFEVENRHDGAIRDNKGKVYLCAEWEFDTNTIFKDKGEINKLANTCKKHNNCDAFLFTYTLDTNYQEFCEKVYNQWNENYNEKDYVLYLVTALMKKDEIENIRYVYGLRTVVIGKGFIQIWEDEK